MPGVRGSRAGHHVCRHRVPCAEVHLVRRLFKINLNLVDRGNLDQHEAFFASGARQALIERDYLQ
jgi:hypothetical protein